MNQTDFGIIIQHIYIRNAPVHGDSCNSGVNVLKTVATCIYFIKPLKLMVAVVDTLGLMIYQIGYLDIIFL